jgi:hypothetical protein
MMRVHTSRVAARRRGALRCWQEVVARRRVAWRVVASGTLLCRLRWWLWSARASSRARALRVYASSVSRLVRLRVAMQHWGVRASREVRVERRRAVGHHRARSRAWDAWLAFTIWELREMRRREAAARCARRQALGRGCLQLARQCVRRTRGDVLMQLAEEVLARHVLHGWASFAQRMPAAVDARARRNADVASRFWRLRALFRAFGRLVARTASNPSR